MFPKNCMSSNIRAVHNHNKAENATNANMKYHHEKDRDRCHFNYVSKDNM